MSGTDPILDTALRELSTNRGLALGDVHGDISNPEWLNANMPALRAAGVTTLYMEMFFTKDQPLIDRYLAGDDQAATPLRAALRNRWEGRLGGVGAGEAYFSMLENARTQGMRVVGIDADELNGTPDRLATANPAWAVTIEADQRANPGGKFLVYVGSAHTARAVYMAPPSEGNGMEPERIALGIDGELGIPSIDFNKYRLTGRVTGEPAPTTLAVRTNGNDSSFIADLPRSDNQRDSGQAPAPRYVLPPTIELQVAALSFPLNNLDPATVAEHGGPSTTPSAPSIIVAPTR